MPSFDDIRQQFPETKDLSDAQLVQRLSDATKMPITDVANSLGYQMPKSDLGKEGMAGLNSYASGPARVLDYAARGMGATGIADAARGYAERHEASAKVLQGASNAPHSLDDIKFGDSDKGVLNYLGAQAAGMAPYALEQGALALATGGSSAVYGIAKGIARTGLTKAASEEAIQALVKKGLTREAAEATASGLGAARTAVGAGAGSVAMTGQALGQQMEQAGKYDGPTAAAAGIGSSLLGQVGIGGMIARRTGVPIAGNVQSKIGRTLLAGATGSVEQGIAMGGMEAANTYARKGVDDSVDMTSPENLKKYGEAAAGGALFGGALGLGHGVLSKYQPKSKTGDAVGDAISQDDTTSAPPQVEQTPPSPSGPPQIIDPAAQAGAAATAPQGKPSKGPAPASNEEKTAMLAKYGDPTPLDSVEGVKWDGRPHYGDYEKLGKPDSTLSKVLDKQALLEREKSDIEHQAESALANTVDGHMMPKEVAKFGELYKGADSVDEVVARVTHAMQEPAKKLEVELDKGEAKANHKTVDKLQQQVGVFQKWIDKLKPEDKNAENDRSQTSEPAQSTEGNGISAQAGERSVAVDPQAGKPGEQVVRDGRNSATKNASDAQATKSPGVEGREQIRVRSEPENTQQVLTPVDRSSVKLEQQAQAHELYKRNSAGEKLAGTDLTHIADHHPLEEVRHEYAKFATPSESGVKKQGYAARLTDEQKGTELQRVNDAMYADPVKGKRDEGFITQNQANGTSADKLRQAWNAQNPEKGIKSKATVANIIKPENVALRRKNAYDALGIHQDDRDILEAHKAREEKAAGDEKAALTSKFDEGREGTGSDAVDHNTREGMGEIATSGSSQGNIKEKGSLGEKFAKAKTDEERAAITAEAAKAEKKVQAAAALEEKTAKKVIDPDAKKKVLAKKKDVIGTKIEEAKAKEKADARKARFDELKAKLNVHGLTEAEAKEMEAATYDKKPALRVVKKGAVEEKKRIDPATLKLARKEIEERAKAGLEAKNGKNKSVSAARRVWDKAGKVTEEQQVSFAQHTKEQTGKEVVAKDTVPEGFPRFHELSPELQDEAARLNDAGALDMKNMNDIYERHVAELEAKNEGREDYGTPPEERNGDDAYPEDYDHVWHSKSAREQIRSPEFKKWFGESKVVSRDGEPLVLYHGTRADISSFDAPESVKLKSSPFAMGNRGLYFTKDPQYAGVYAKSRDGTRQAEGGNILPVYLRMENPLVMRDTDAGFDRFASAHVSDARIAELKAQGYDGIINPSMNEYVAFDPEQIKSAIGNSGTFDAANPDIRFSKAVDGVTNGLPKNEAAGAKALNDFFAKAGDDYQKSGIEDTPLAQAHPAVVEFMQNMKDLGVIKHLSSVSEWKREDLGTSNFGEINVNPDGTYSITLNERLLNDNSLGDARSHALIAEVLAHEAWHNIDMVGRLGEGVYSGQTEMQMRRAADGTVRGSGPVARELVALYNKGESPLAKLLQYPLSEKFADLSRQRVQEETFAQIASAFTDPTNHEVIKRDAPLTYKYMQEVVEHAKSTEAIHSTTEQIAGERGESFKNRATDGSIDGNSKHERPNQKREGGGGRDDTRLSTSDHALEQPAERAERLYRESGLKPSSPGISGNETLIDRAINASPKPLKDGLTSIATTMGNISRKAGFTTLFGHDLADLAKTQYGMEKPKEFMNLISQNSALKSQLDTTTQRIGGDYVKLSDTAKLAAQTYLRDSTMKDAWGYAPAFKDISTKARGKEGEAGYKPATDGINQEMEARFYNLGADVQQVIRDVNQHGHDTNAMVNKLIVDNINAVYDKKADGLHGTELAQVNTQREFELKKLAGRESDGPYAPLVRFGNHLAVGKSKEYVQAQKDGDQKQIDTLKEDPNHYKVERHETQGKAKAAAEEMRGQFADGQHFYQDMDAYTRENHGDMTNLIQKMKEHLSSGLEGEDKVAADKASDLLRDMYIHNIAENSFRKSMLKRENISGVKPEEMFRGFLSRANSTHHFIANLTNGETLNRHLADMKGEVESTNGDLRAKRQEINNEFVMRRQAMMHSQETPFQNNIMAFTGVHKLLTSPAHYLQYITQPLTMHMPLIAGRHGYLAAAGEMMTSFRDTIKMMKGEEHDMSGLLKSGSESGKREYAMLQSMIRNGALSVGRGDEFGNPKMHIDSMGSKLWNATMAKLGNIPHSLENFNKIGSSLASYRLSYADAIRSGLSSAAAHDKASTRALNDVRSSYGSYDSFNSPRLFQQGGVFKTMPIKVMTQFRKFQVIHMSMLGRLLHGAFKGESPEARAVAAKQLGFMAAHYGVFAGAMGVPASHLLLAAVHKVFGTSDDPEEDKEEWVRKLIGDKDLSNLVLHGLPAFAGADVSGTTGAGDIASIFREGTGDSGDPKKDYQAYVMAAMGPFAGSVLPQMLKGSANIAKGNYYDGLKDLVPKGVANVMKAYGLDQDGYVNKKGDVLIKPEDISLFEKLTQGIGSQPTKIEEINRERNVEYKYENHFKDEQNQLKLEFTRARRNGDDTSDILEKWKAMQEYQSRVGFQTTPFSSLYKAPAEQGKRERSAIEGIETTKKNRGFVRELTSN